MTHKNQLKVQKFIDAKLLQMPQSINLWFDQSQLQDIASSSLIDDFKRLDSDDLAKNYYNYINALGGIKGVQDYNLFKTRVINLPELGETICGIRFRGMDIDKPFINIAISIGQLSALAIAKAVSILKQEFDEFKPRCIRILWCHHPKSKSFEAFENDIHSLGRTIKCDKVFVGNRLNALIDDSDLYNQSIITKQTTFFKAGFDINLIDIAEHKSSYDLYKQSFDELIAIKPEILKLTSCAEYEDLVEIGNTGGFNFVLTKDGNFAGLFSLASNFDNNLGLQGLYVIEKFITPSLQGQGIGKMFEKMVYRKLLEQNLVKPDSIIFGEIDFDNKASLASAYSNGRIEIARHLWVY